MKLNVTASASVILLATAISMATPASASTLYGADYADSATFNSTLYVLDQSTGAASSVGNIGVNIGDLTNVGNTLVGINIQDNRLYTIDPTTGAAGSFVSVSGSRGAITSIAWNPLTNILYGNTTDSYSGSDLLYQIDALTGAATLIGSGLGAANIYGLGFGQDGTLYGTDSGGSVYTVDTGTGLATLLGNSGIAFLFDAASRPEDNALFASPDDFSLVGLNSATGAGSIVGPFGVSANIAGLAFLGGAVPEPSTWATMLLGFGAIGMAFRRTRRVVHAFA